MQGFQFWLRHVVIVAESDLLVSYSSQSLTHWCPTHRRVWLIGAGGSLPTTESDSLVSYPPQNFFKDCNAFAKSKSFLKIIPFIRVLNFVNKFEVENYKNEMSPWHWKSFCLRWTVRKWRFKWEELENIFLVSSHLILFMSCIICFLYAETVFHVYHLFKLAYTV